MQRIIQCALLLPVAVLAEPVATEPVTLPAWPQQDGGWQPVLPPASADAADALDRQVYSQFANDTKRLANQTGFGKPYAWLPHAALATYYDDNIYLSQAHPVSSTVLAVEPGLAGGLGDFRNRQDNFLLADYTGRWTEFFNRRAANGYEQFAKLNGQLQFARWRFRTDFQMLDLNSANVDTGNAGRERVYNTAETVTYAPGEKSFWEAKGQNLIHDYQAGAQSVEWLGRGFYNLQWDPKLLVGAGAGGGLTDVAGNGDQTYEQALLRVHFAPTEKFSIASEGGLEWRQLNSGENKLTPLLDLMAEYLPVAGTRVGLRGYRRNLTSGASGDQDYTASGVELSYAQELGSRWVLGFQAGFENNDYFFTDQRAPSPRQDNFFFLNPSLTYRFNEHAKVEIFYNHRQNESNNLPREFANNQTGLRFALTF